MTPERWEKVRDVLGQVLELAPDRRSPFLDDACASDPSLRSEVESLLSSDETARSSFLQSPPPVPAALTKGTRLGDYEIISLIGSGGMGEVYRARDTKLKREVAIKVLPAYWSRDPDRLQRFELEARATAALNHPNITSIFHVGQHDGSPFIVTELLQGETLRERLRKGPMRLHEALDCGAEIARGLGAAHDAGVIHRDLKPENIFVTKDGRIKILDFGLAKLQVPKSAKPEDPTLIPRQTNPGQVLGTVGYMSPEQVRGQAADARSDIFALGSVLYEMLTGKQAFRKATSAETMSAILNEDPPAVSQVTPNLPPGLRRVVNRCLTKSPEQRFQHASDVAFALEATSDSGSGTLSAAQPPSGRKWLWVTTSVAILSVAAAVILWWNRPGAIPIVESVTQLTDDGVPKQGPLTTDGSRIYFNEGSIGSWRIAQVAVAGGETSIVATRFSNALLVGLVPDGSSLLVSTAIEDWAAGPLWTIPLPTGEPRRLGTIEAEHAGFFPDGRLVFTRGTGLYVAEKDGSNPRRLLSTPDETFCPSVSPNGKRIVFLKSPLIGTSNALVEVGADGFGAREMLRGQPGATQGCGFWSLDGTYLFYGAYHPGRSDIWALPVGSKFSFRRREPIQLTNGPLSYSGLTQSRDGKRIFAIGTKRRGELVQYDKTSGNFVPFFSGISATDPTFSRDGKWVAYVSFPDHALWRSRADGSDRLQLTYSPMEVELPVISQDGRQVAFRTSDDEVYTVDMEGGMLRKIDVKNAFGGTFSPDGNSMVLTVFREGKHLGDTDASELRILDFRTGALSPVPSSQGLGGAFWVNEDTIVAVSDFKKILLFNFKTTQWSEFPSGQIVNWMPSPDGKYLYYSTGGADSEARRFRVADHHVEKITSLKNLRRVNNRGTQISVAPDGSAIFTRDIGTQEIYALRVKWP